MRNLNLCGYYYTYFIKEEPAMANINIHIICDLYEVIKLISFEFILLYMVFFMDLENIAALLIMKLLLDHIMLRK